MTTQAKDQRQRNVIIALLATLCIIAVGWFLHVAQNTLIPLVIAWLLSCLFGPVVRFLTKKRVPRPMAIFFVIFLAFYLIWLTILFFQARFNAFVGEYANYADKLRILINSFGKKLPDGALASLQLYDWQGRAYAFILEISKMLFSILSQLIVIMIFVIFLLIGQPHFDGKLRMAFSDTQASRIAGIINGITGQVGQYLALQSAISAITGVCVWLVLDLLGVDFAKTWGALAFILNFIPTIGSILASIPPILIALVDYGQSASWRVVAVALALLTIQMVIGNGIAPKLMGDRLNLSPVIVLISLFFWGWLWGPVGALLSVLIASAIKIICDNVSDLHPVGIMMGAGSRGRAHRHRSSRSQS